MMPMTYEQRQWLHEHRQELKRRLDELVSLKTWPGYMDRSERLQELKEQLENVERQLREEEH